MSNAIPQKRCYRCEQTYPLDFFYNNRANSDGKADACKQCAKEIQADRRKQQDYSIAKHCSCCKEMKPISEYWGAYPYCKSCSYAMRRERYKQIGGITEEEKQYRRVLYLKRNFNLSIGEYDAMFAQQFGLCAICGKPETHKNRGSKEINKLAVDHCHKTGLVRELLCMKCNAMLANASDNPEILRKGATYLEKHGI